MDLDCAQAVGATVMRSLSLPGPFLLHRWPRMLAEVAIQLPCVVASLAAIADSIGAVMFSSTKSHGCFPVHPATGVVLVLVGGILLWANLRETGWKKSLGNLKPPANADPIMQVMFYRGWPLPPCLVCMFHGGKWHPEEGGVHLALILDGLVFCCTLLALWFVCERCFRRWGRDPDAGSA